MYELIQLTEHDYYFDCPAKVGLVRTEDQKVVLIDSGNDKDAGKKVLRVLLEKGWELSAILNTHSHADHTGGNRFLQEKTGCRIFAAGPERAVASCPVLEPASLYGGFPFHDLRNKFLMAQESRVEELTPDVLPEGMKMLDLPGHCFAMKGFLTKDGTAYLADCVSSEETLTKYGIGYMWDVKAELETFEKLLTLEAARYVPSHAGVTEDIRPLSVQNRDAVLSLLSLITELLKEPLGFEELLAKIFESYHLVMNTQQYMLIGSTIRSCLAYLLEEGALAVSFSENHMLWQKRVPASD